VSLIPKVGPRFTAAAGPKLPPNPYRNSSPNLIPKVGGICAESVDKFTTVFSER